MNRIRELRVIKGLKQSELGQKIGASRSSISKYESEDRQLDPATIHALCDLFGCTADYLLGRASTPWPVISEEDAGIPRDAVPKDRNLARFLRIRDAAAEKKEGLSAAELELVRKRAAEADPVAGMVLCQCYLGFRPTELLSLKKADYNAQERAFVGGIKTAAGIDRTVTVSPKIRAYVEAALAVCGDGYVFGRQGRQLRPEQYRELFYLLLEDLGISNPVDDQNRHRLTPHSCRHTFATLMKAASGSDADKLALIGHTSTEQLRDYQDVRFEDLRAITDQL